MSIQLLMFFELISQFNPIYSLVVNRHHTFRGANRLATRAWLVLCPHIQLHRMYRKELTMNVKAILAALCLSASGAAFSATSGEDTALVPPTANGQGLTRAEVLADLALWTRAGMPQHANSESASDLTSSAYREAYARYLRLRSSAAYAEEVRRIADLRGEPAPLASGG
ncbi:TPA: DUF4148 domain-containing protein [Pseudomonas aeruginosa]